MEYQHAAPLLKKTRWPVGIAMIPSTLGRIPSCSKGHQQRRRRNQPCRYGTFPSGLDRLHRRIVRVSNPFLSFGCRNAHDLGDGLAEIAAVCIA